MAYGTRAKTTAASGAAAARPNYRALAGIEGDDHVPRRTPAQVAADLRQEENSRREAEAKKAAIAQRIAELEEEMARQDELRVDQAIALASIGSPLLTGVMVESNVGDTASRASKVTSKLRKTGAKVKKLSRADIEAAKHAKENESSGKRRPTDEDAPAFQATSTPAKRSKGAAGPSGLRAGWQPQRTPTPTVPQRASVVSNTVRAALTGLSAAAEQSQGAEDFWSDHEEAPLAGLSAAIQPVVAVPERNTLQGIAQVKRSSTLQQAGSVSKIAPAEPPSSTVVAQAAVTPHSSGRASGGKKTFTNGDIPIPTQLHWKWRRLLIPRFLTIIGEYSANPWSTINLDVSGILQALWKDIFPDLPVTISPREPIHDVAQQRVYEWRAAIARAALDAVANFLQTYFVTSQARADYVQYALGPGLPFRYASVKTSVDSRETKSVGPFQSAYILDTLAYDFAATGRTVEKSRDFPFSALTLSVVAVERALQRWMTGEYVKPAASDKEAKKKDAFSQEARADSTRSYLRAVANLRETTWIHIMQGAEERVRATAPRDADDIALLYDDIMDDERAVVDESDDDDQ